jgi:hypothetical protein
MPALAAPPSAGASPANPPTDRKAAAPSGLTSEEAGRRL